MSMKLKKVSYVYSEGDAFEKKALDEISLEIPDGQFIGIIGHTGSGKSTLIQHLNGLLRATSGAIYYDGENIYQEGYDMRTLRSKVGLVFQYPEHQLFEVDVFSDVCFGPKNLGLSKEEVEERAKKALIQVGLDESYYKKSPFELSGGQKRRVAIAGILAMHPQVLILDEPTAVLTPQESDRLFDILRNMRKDGCSIMIITHKLQEVLALSDRVAILRKGKYIDTVETAQANAQSLSEMMVGGRVDLNIDRPEPENVKKRLVVKGLNCKNKEEVKTLDDVDLTVNAGEILGIAGISGSGQKEFLEAIAGLQAIESGSITLFDDNGKGTELAGMDSISINKAGISLAFVPEDRIGMGLVGDMDMTDNMMLRSYRNGKSPFLDRKGPKALALKIKEQLEVMTPSISAPVRQMSGGNVQKVLVGREIAQNPKVLLVAFPTRGVDVNTSHVIYRLLNEQKKKGVAVVCVIEDLDVVLELCDRIAVFCGGKISGIEDGRTATKEEIGLLMTKHEKGGTQA